MANLQTPLVDTSIAVLVGRSVHAVQLRIWEQKPSSYTAGMRMLVGVLPAADQDSTAYDPRYYAWLTSEYLVDDFTEVVRSALFAENVSMRLSEEEIVVPPGVIQGSAATGKQHRIISLNFNWGDPAELETIATASAAELTENSAFYFQQLGTEGAGVTLLDGPHVAEVGPSIARPSRSAASHADRFFGRHRHRLPDGLHGYECARAQGFGNVGDGRDW